LAAARRIDEDDIVVLGDRFDHASIGVEHVVPIDAREPDDRAAHREDTSIWSTYNGFNDFNVFVVES
jgi:hypothetical protein